VAANLIVTDYPDQQDVPHGKREAESSEEGHIPTDSEDEIVEEGEIVEDSRYPFTESEDGKWYNSTYLPIGNNGYSIGPSDPSYEEAKAADDNWVWPMDFAPPDVNHPGTKKKYQSVPIGLMKAMTYSGPDEKTAEFPEYTDENKDHQQISRADNENARRRRLNLDLLDPSIQDDRGNVQLTQHGYEDAIAMFNAVEGDPPDPTKPDKPMNPKDKEIMKAIMRPNQIQIDGENYNWSLGNEIVLRDTVGQLCFALKFTFPDGFDFDNRWEVRDDEGVVTGLQFENRALGAVNIKDTKGTFDTKQNQTLFSTRLSRRQAIGSLGFNMQNDNLTSQRPREWYREPFFEMCYQGAIEAINGQYERLPENIKKMLSRGGGRLKPENISDIHTALMVGNCTQYDLVGIMENTVMKVMAKLERDFNFVVEPTPYRVRKLAVAEPLTAVGWNTYTANGPVHSWGDLWRDRYAHAPRLQEAPTIGSPRKKPKKRKKPKPGDTPIRDRPAYERRIDRERAAAAIARSLKEQAKLAATKAKLAKYKGDDSQSSRPPAKKYKGDDDGKDL